MVDNIKNKNYGHNGWQFLEWKFSTIKVWVLKISIATMLVTYIEISTLAHMCSKCFGVAWQLPSILFSYLVQKNIYILP